MKKLNKTDINLLGLTKRSKPGSDGWYHISKVIWNELGYKFRSDLYEVVNRRDEFYIKPTVACECLLKQVK